MGRRHGLQAPLDPHQLSSWLLFFGLAAGCYAFLLPFAEPVELRWFLVSLYSISVVFVVLLDLWTSAIDPSDPGVKGEGDTPAGEFFCSLCQAAVSKTSKHCRACDRCVDNFDHHCKWLNTCVGSSNYRHFFSLISSALWLLVLQFAWAAWLFVRSFVDRPAMQLLVRTQYSGSVNFIGWQVSLGVYSAVLAAAIYMIGELWCFHIVLMCKGMTTYDYIIAQRDAHLSSAVLMNTSTNGCSGVGCRSNQVADEAVAPRRKPKIGINPCAALKTEKVAGPPRVYNGGGAKGVHPMNTPRPKGAGASSLHGSPAPAPRGATGEGVKHVHGVGDMISRAVELQKAHEAMRIAGKAYPSVTLQGDAFPPRAGAGLSSPTEAGRGGGCGESCQQPQDYAGTPRNQTLPPPASLLFSDLLGGSAPAPPPQAPTTSPRHLAHPHLGHGLSGAASPGNAGLGPHTHAHMHPHTHTPSGGSAQQPVTGMHLGSYPPPLGRSHGPAAGIPVTASGLSPEGHVLVGPEVTGQGGAGQGGVGSLVFPPGSPMAARGGAVKLPSLTHERGPLL